MAEKMKIQLTICTGGTGAPKKYNCPDCYYCQHCPDDRCKVCLREQRGKGKPKSAKGSADGPCCRKITTAK